MRRFLAACLLFTLLLPPARACINEKKALLDGRIREGDAEPVLRRPDTTGNAVARGRLLATYDSLWRQGGDLDAYSDYGVQLIYLGRYPQARAVYQEIERRAPGRYATAANLGTLYELMGKNDSALLWIQKAVRIDPASHAGSEWIHVNLLKVKLGQAPLGARALLGTDFGSAVIPQLTDISPNEAAALQRQLTYQLEERLRFVAPPDSIVGALVFELGNLTAIGLNTTDALRLYDIAIAYGYGSPLLDERYAHFVSLQKGLDNEYSDARVREQRFPFHEPRLEERVQPRRLLWLLGGGGLLLVLSVWVLWRLTRRRRA